MLHVSILLLPMDRLLIFYRPLGVAASITNVITGRILDWNYRRGAKQLNFPVDRKRGEDLRDFPIELARIQVLLPLLALGIAALTAYGWALNQKTRLEGALILTFVLGYATIGCAAIFSTLLVDLYPLSPSTATAGNNLVRCLCGALASSVYDLMIGRMGIGWCFTFFALLPLLSTPALLMLVRRGQRWRESRRVRLAEKEHATEAREGAKIESEKEEVKAQEKEEKKANAVSTH